MALRLKDKIKPDKDGLFAIADAEDIAYKDGRLQDFIPITLTQEEYNTLKASGKLNANTPYLIVEGDV